jgi:DNA-binding NarL/FixJ family response regulator
LLIACAAVAPAQRRSADGPLFPPWPAVWSSYNSRPKDCHRAVVDKQGRMVMVGVETIGDSRSVEARQSITMPRMTGLELAEQIHCERPNIHVLLMSGYASGMLREYATSQSFVQKPFAPKKLTDKVAELLNRTQSNGISKM